MNNSIENTSEFNKDVWKEIKLYQTRIDQNKKEIRNCLNKINGNNTQYDIDNIEKEITASILSIVYFTEKIIEDKQEIINNAKIV